MCSRITYLSYLGDVDAKLVITNTVNKAVEYVTYWKVSGGLHRSIESIACQACYYSSLQNYSLSQGHG